MACGVQEGNNKLNMLKLNQSVRIVLVIFKAFLENC